MNVAFTQHDVVVAADFHFVAVIGTEQHAVPDFCRPDVCAEGHDFCPHQALADLCSGRNEDSATRATLSFVLGNAHEQPVVQHLDGKLLVTGRHAMHGTVGGVRVETVSLQTLDGLVLEADLVRADGGAAPSMAWVVCHPHPLYGGDRHNTVVRNIVASVVQRDGLALAPDFRGVGHSEGVHDGEGAERLDVAAAIGFLATIAPEAPIVVAGYSFGAATCLNVSDPRAHCWAVVAPPVAMLSGECVARRDHRRTHVVIPAHDQFTSVDAAHEEFSRWTNVELHVAHTADHFMAGQADELDALVRRVHSTLS